MCTVIERNCIGGRSILNTAAAIGGTTRRLLARIVPPAEAGHRLGSGRAGAAGRLTISTLVGGGSKRDARVALDAVAAAVAEHHAVGQDLDRLHLAEREPVVVGEVAAHLEHVAEVGAEREAHRQLDRVRVVVEQPEALVQAVVVQEAIAADADRARLGDDLPVWTDQRVVGELQVAHEVELARRRQQRSGGCR